MPLECIPYVGRSRDHISPLYVSHKAQHSVLHLEETIVINRPRNGEFFLAGSHQAQDSLLLVHMEINPIQNYI